MTFPAMVFAATETATPSPALHRIDAELLGEVGDLGALLVDRFAEVFRPTEIGELTRDGQAILDSRIDHRADVGGDALAQIERHSRWPKQSDQAVDGQRRIARFRDRRQV